MRSALYLVPLVVASLVAGCVGAPAPPPERSVPETAPPPAPAVAPPLATDWRDWPQTPGDWRYVRYNGRSSATFGTTEPGALTLSCTADRTIRITRPGTAAGAMTVRTTSLTRVLPTTAVGEPPAGSLATLAASDPLLDAIGFSRGRFVVQQEGRPPLVLPAWAEVERVVEDCRGGA